MGGSGEDQAGAAGMLTLSSSWQAAQEVDWTPVEQPTTVWTSDVDLEETAFRSGLETCPRP